MNNLENLIFSSKFNAEKNPWVIHIKSGILSRVDVNNRQYKYKKFLGLVEDNSFFSDVLQADNKLFMVPSRQNGQSFIGLIDLATLEYKKIYLKRSSVSGKGLEPPLFTGVQRVGDYIFFIGCGYPAIVRVKIDTLEVNYIENWVNSIRNILPYPKENVYFIAKQYEVNNQYLYIPFCKIPAILKININTLEEDVIHLSDDTGGYSCICCFEKGKMLLPGAYERVDWLYLWDEKTGDIVKNSFPQKSNSSLSIMSILKDKYGDMYMFPWQNWDGLDLDIYFMKKQIFEIKSMGLLEKHGTLTDCVWNDEIIHASWKNENTIIYVTGKDLLWHEYDVESKTKKDYEMFVDKKNEEYKMCRLQYYQALAKNQIPIWEEDLGMDSFVSLCNTI